MIDVSLFSSSIDVLKIPPTHQFEALTFPPASKKPRKTDWFCGGTIATNTNKNIRAMVIPPLIGNPYNGYIDPYYWVGDHPLLYGNNGSLDPGAYNYTCTIETQDNP